MADYDISKAFEVIEDELIRSMIRNLDRHRAEETAQGFNWSQWQAEQLRALEEYRRKNRKIFPERFNKLNSQITQLLNDSYHNGSVKQERRILQEIKRGFKGKGTNEPPYTGKTEMTGEFFGVNDRKLQSLIDATTHDMQKAETAVLRLADDQYRKAIFNAQVYANAGAGTYEKAVDMATRDMLRAGLNCIQYRNGARHTLSDYADMAIKTAVKRAYLQGEGKKRQEWGIPTVILNKRSSPCPECLPFVGRVFIDDVWSGGDTSGISPITGIKYPLLSEAIAQGLYHPRCKDSHTTYFEGINSTPEDSEYTKEELKALAEEYELLAEQEKQEQKVSQAKNQAKKCERISQYSLDEENKKIYKARAEQWREKEKVYADTLNAITTENQKVLNSSNNPTVENSTSNTVANSNDSSIIDNEKSSKVLNPDVKVESVPKIQIGGLEESQNENIQKTCVTLLEKVQNLPENTEMIFCLDYATMKIVSSKVGDYGKSSVGLDKSNSTFDYATLHNHPSNTVIGIKDIEKFLNNRNEKMTMTIGNRGKFSALMKTKKSNPFGYMVFIAGEKGKRITEQITVKQILDNPEIINTIPPEELNIAYDRLEKIQYNIAKKSEKYGYKFIEI